MLDGDNPAELQCTVVIEWLNSCGQATKRRLFKRASVTIGRNEFKEIVLRVHDGKIPHSFTVSDVQLFNRFAKDGKCTVKFLPENVQVLMSDCPPDRLSTFLKTLSIKHLAWKTSKCLGDRAKLLACKNWRFEAISPVQKKDVEKANAFQNKVNAPMAPAGHPERRANTTARAQQVKRPRNLCDFSPIKDKRPEKRPFFTLPTDYQLSREQSSVLDAVLSGKNVFFTGSAGTGKSFLLKRIVGSLPPKSTYATASTGVAASYIGGTTLHNFAGIGSGLGSLEQCLELAQRPMVLPNWTSCQHLIIDEISMVDAQLFDKLETIARSIKRSPEPFGGIQLILCGDFLQLPPVSKGKDNPKYCFQIFSNMLTIYLTKAHIVPPSSRVTEVVTGQLLKSASHSIERDGIIATRLCTHKDDVELTNENKLKQLQGPSRMFEAVDSDPHWLKLIDTICPVGRLLQLKVGAQVRTFTCLRLFYLKITYNKHVSFACSGLPRVQFLCGVTKVIKPERWVFKANGGTYVSRQQLPLKLAWAISIHKSQGMTLDCVEISLARVFESGQAYVALSRARSFEGMRVLDFNPCVVQANQDVLQFYRKLKKENVHMQLSMDLFLPKLNTGP
uniref:ATP-dependent DNA helicase n=1 Tax=Denticeps clupeoides TaxID=299321 RepID=A0A8C3ZNY8_9TELE